VLPVPAGTVIGFAKAQDTHAALCTSFTPPLDARVYVLAIIDNGIPPATVYKAKDSDSMTLFDFRAVPMHMEASVMFMTVAGPKNSMAPSPS